MAGTSQRGPDVVEKLLLPSRARTKGPSAILLSSVVTSYEQSIKKYVRPFSGGTRRALQIGDCVLFILGYNALFLKFFQDLIWVSSFSFSYAFNRNQNKENKVPVIYFYQ